MGVYGIVALIIRMDEFGLRLIDLNERQDSFSDKVGNLLVQALPYVIKSLAVIGTIALLLVAGGIFTHNLDFMHDFLHSLPALLRDFIVGLLAGAAVLLLVKGVVAAWK